MQRALLRMSGIAALLVLFVLMGCAALPSDVQTYHIASDGTGLHLLRELRDAAARGVGVRLLVDDLYAAGQDELFGAPAAHQHVEVRLFNPLPVIDHQRLIAEDLLCAPPSGAAGRCKACNAAFKSFVA